MICSRFLGKLDDIPPLSEVGWCHVKKSRNSPELISGKIQVQGSKYSEILFKFNPIISKIWSFSQVWFMRHPPSPCTSIFVVSVHLLLGRLKRWVARCCLGGCLADGSPAVSGKNDLQRFIAAATATSWRISHVGGRQVGVWWSTWLANLLEPGFCYWWKARQKWFWWMTQMEHVAFCADFNW